MPLFKPLMKKLVYLSEEQIEKVYQAFLTAKDAHSGQKRDSGEEYLIHPIAVASILADMHLDHESIMAALLHDVIEDTAITKEFVLNKFGTSVAELVDAVTKLSQIEFSSKAEAKAESFRKMILAMSHDIRVILVKLADRLHNMQTLGGVAPHKRVRIARETIEIYAPIANRLGMHNISIQLESLSFAFLYPRRQRILQKAIEQTRGSRKEVMELIEKELNLAVENSNIEKSDIEILGREKSLYGIYKKMVERHVDFAEIMDLYAFRIITKSVDECYRILGLVHGLYKPIPGKFKDYIAIPKFNGYQSLHTILLGPYGIPIEIQIRTESMDQMANNGISAHWLYKSGEKATDAAHIRAQQWVNNLLEMQQNTGSSLDFIENVKIDLFPDEIYVFTPKGNIMELPRGATIVDFAYAVHSDIGNTCVAARIDRQFVPLSTTLFNGQTVSVITAPGAKPNPGWLNFVVTARAKSGIRAFLKNLQLSETIELGKQLLSEALAAISISPHEIPPLIIEEVLLKTNIKNIEELYEEIGLGNRISIFVAHQIADYMHKEVSSNFNNSESKPLLIKGAEGVAITFGQCCYPVPGDAIIGYFDPEMHGLVIHAENCPNAPKLHRHPDKCLPVNWADDVQGNFQTEINVEALNQRGALAQLAQAISSADSNIDDISVHDSSGGYCLVNIKLSVKNLLHLERVLRHISNLPVVAGVIRKR